METITVEMLQQLQQAYKRAQRKAEELEQAFIAAEHERQRLRSLRDKAWAMFHAQVMEMELPFDVNVDALARAIRSVSTEASTGTDGGLHAKTQLDAQP